MAKTNKYTSINFNHIYDKNLSNNSKTANNNPSKIPSSISSPNKPHGRMLVLTRPTPKPIASPPLQPPPADHPQDHTRSHPDSDLISLRPLGRTGTTAIAPIPGFDKAKDKEIPHPVVALHKPEKFVPPHLRAGFVGKEERPVNVGIRNPNQRQYYGNYGSPNRYGDDGRPKSGGGYEKRRVAADMDLRSAVNRPRSSGNRPTTSG